MSSSAAVRVVLVPTSWSPASSIALSRCEGLSAVICGEADKKHGFKNFAEYEAVAASISLVMAAIDPQTKVFTDPHTAIKKELEDVSAETNISSSQKTKLLRSLNLALRAARAIQFPTNIELVQKYYNKIDVTTIAAYDGDSWRNSSIVRTISE